MNPDDQFMHNNSFIVDLNQSRAELIDTHQVQQDARRSKKAIKVLQSPEKRSDGFFLSQSNLDEGQLINLSGPNTEKANHEGFFLGGLQNQVMKQNMRKEEQIKKTKIDDSKDPYVVFQSQDPNYPVKEDEMSFMDRFCSENMQGLPTLPTGKCALYCNLVCWFYFMTFGVVFIVIANSVQQFTLDYGIKCDGQKLCYLEFEVDEIIDGPLFLYYQLSEFYQSHSDFASSVVPLQMLGGDLTLDQIQKHCHGAIYLSDMNRNDTIMSAAGQLMDYTQVANPCGIAAKYYFNGSVDPNLQIDSFSLFSPANQSIFINQTSISFEVDRDYKYKRSGLMFRMVLSYIITKQEHVMNWFNLQSLPLLRKLWGIVVDQIQPGNYTVVINNQYNINLFGGEKSLIFTTMSSFGCKSYVFGILLIATSFLQLLSAIVIYRKHLSQQKKYMIDTKIYMDPYDESPGDKKKSE